MFPKGIKVIDALVVITVIAIVAVIAISTWSIKTLYEPEPPLQTTLQTIRHSLETFNQDTGCWPDRLNDLTNPLSEPPVSGVGSHGRRVVIDPLKYEGPYLKEIPINPITGGNVEGEDWFYEFHPKVRTTASGRAIDDTNYADW
ncbi:MAG: hypothetical protein AAB785_02165 [Patescibacteria group bacterium]